MIKAMKLQKALIAIILGVLALVAYLIMDANDVSWSRYVLEASGLFLMLGALLFLYPILFARKDKEGCVELDPEAPLAETPDSQGKF
ncbi:isoleucyl-tRNA synthetase [Pedobacter sp. MC2016-15]|uniref:isoleucyl-tRNA synthetase n=1 Tax=Pedobacter sp. MC2016-15 TaxID=2994473 RepID=UPI0022476F2E|nr:isoleucyl-tRNA synthetase [Pedobacter sp. MC2016-15]MCX2478845.1 isoleucyl-tRNA synthetase [Pedobacter sp. MC2016-15]